MGCTLGSSHHLEIGNFPTPYAGLQYGVRRYWLPITVLPTESQWPLRMATCSQHNGSIRDASPQSGLHTLPMFLGKRHPYVKSQKVNTRNIIPDSSDFQGGIAVGPSISWRFYHRLPSRPSVHRETMKRRAVCPRDLGRFQTFHVCHWKPTTAAPKNPLVNIQKNYGKIHHFSWENSLFLWPFSEGRHHFPETIRNPNIIAHFETKHRSTKYATGLPLPVLGARNVVNLSWDRHQPESLSFCSEFSL